MTIAQLPVPYPRDDHEAHALMAIYAVVLGGWMAVLIVQAVREKDVRFLLALARFLAAKLKAKPKDKG
jgi:hypothetical protein